MPHAIGKNECRDKSLNLGGTAGYNTARPLEDRAVFLIEIKRKEDKLWQRKH